MEPPAVPDDNIRSFLDPRNRDMQVSLPAQALNSTRIGNLPMTEDTISSGRGNRSSSSSASQPARISVRLRVNPTDPQPIRELDQKDVLWEQGMPLLGLAVSFMGICQQDKLMALKPLGPCLIFQLLGSVVCNSVGRSLKTAFPKASVSAMILSKALLYSAFSTIIFKISSDGNPYVIWSAYLAIATMFCTFFYTVGYSLWKDGVREPQEIEIDAMV